MWSMSTKGTLQRIPWSDLQIWNALVQKKECIVFDRRLREIRLNWNLFYDFNMLRSFSTDWNFHGLSNQCCSFWICYYKAMIRFLVQDLKEMTAKYHWCVCIQWSCNRYRRRIKCWERNMIFAWRISISYLW